MKPIPTDPPRKILVLRLKAIGDVLLATPVVRALRQAFPSATLHFLTRSSGEPFLRHNPHLDRVIVHPEKSASLASRLSIFRELAAFRYDWALDLESTPRSALLALSTLAPVRVGYAFRVRKWAFTHPVPRNRVRKYQGEVCLDLLRHLGVEGDGPRTELRLGEGEGAKAGDWYSRNAVPAPRIGLNPTGSWSAKRWPQERWRELVLILNSRLGVKPVLFWGPGAEDLVQGITRGMEDKCLLLPPTDLLEAAAFISGMDLLIGNDGTPQHMAQALGVPSLTLFGPSWAIGYRPPEGRHLALQHFLDCGPCDHTVCPHPPKGTTTGHYERECLDRISPEEVARAAALLLPQGGARFPM